MIITMSADANSDEEFLSNFVSFLNLKLLILNIFVRLFSSDVDVLRYSHERITKKISPIRIQVIASSFGDVASSDILRRTISGSAFCFFVAPSWFRYPRYCS